MSNIRVAGLLGTSLQRSLARGQVTFRQLVDEARLHIARTLLRETSLPVQDVAIRIGYQTAGSFARLRPVDRAISA